MTMIEYLGFLTPCAFVAILVISALADGRWKFGVNYICDLGVSKSRVAAITFNAGLIICGAMFFVYSAWMINISLDNNEMLGFSTFVIGAVMSVFLSLLGAIDENKRPYHRYIARSLFLIASVFLSALLFTDLLNGSYMLAVVTLACILTVLFSFRFKSVPLTEALGAVSIVILLIVHFI